MRQLGKRVGLIHELRELAAGRRNRGSRRRAPFGLMSFCGVMPSVFTSNSVMRSLTRRSVRDRPGTALIGEKFADRTDATAAELIDIVGAPLAAAKVDDVLRGSYDVLVGDDPVSRPTSMESFWLIL